MLVQAAPTPAETDYSWGLAAETPLFVAGVVGWADFDGAADAVRAIEGLAAHPMLKGLRPHDLGHP